MVRDPMSPPKQSQTSHPKPAMQSTPQAKGSVTMSEHISTVGVQVSDIRPWIKRDVEKFQECGIDEMLKHLLVDLSTRPRKSVDDAYKTRLFERCLDQVLPICNGEDKILGDGMKGKLYEVKEALRTYSEIQTEKELCPAFVRVANTALLFLEELEVEDMRLAEGPAVYFHVNNPMTIIQEDHASHRKPDVIVVSDKDVCNGKGFPADIYTQKEHLLNLAKDFPENVFEWRGVRTFVEFRKAKKKMEPPPGRYYSQKYTPPQDQYLTLAILSKPGLGAPPEALVASEVNPRLPPPNSVQQPYRQLRTSTAVNSDSNAYERSSDHLDLPEFRSKLTQPMHQREQPVIVQAGYHAAEMFTAHTARLHVIGLIVVDDVLYFWWYDRQGTIQCSGFNFIQDLPRFLVLLLAMQRFREQDWGLNPHIDPKFGPRPESHEVILSDEKDEKIEVVLELSDKERIPHYGLNSPAANLFPIKYKSPPVKDNLVVKVFWAEVARTSEPDVLRRVYDIGKDDNDIKGHVPDMLWYKAFKDVSTAKVRECLGLKTEGARVLYMINFRRLRPITELTGPDFLHAWWETVKCHVALWKKQIYHRDISPPNLMYRKDEGKIVGVLDNFSLVSTPRITIGTERTGTTPFMAPDLLNELPLQGNTGHAIDRAGGSFVQLLIWGSLWDDGGGMFHGHGQPLDDQLKVDAVGCWKEKSDFLKGKAAHLTHAASLPSALEALMSMLTIVSQNKCKQLLHPQDSVYIGVASMLQHSLLLSQQKAGLVPVAWPEVVPVRQLLSKQAAELVSKLSIPNADKILLVDHLSDEKNEPEVHFFVAFKGDVQKMWAERILNKIKHSKGLL